MFRVLEVAALSVLYQTLCMQREATEAQIIPRPKDTVTLPGRRVRFECALNQNNGLVNWKFTAVGISVPQNVFVVGEISDSLKPTHKTENTTNTLYSLVIESVNLSNAGTYNCTDTSEKSSAEAQLIVLASDPICGTNVSSSVGGILENDSVHMSCGVNYSGNWIPRMEWFRNSGQAIPHNIVITNGSNHVTTLTSSVTIQLNSSDNGTVFKCTTSVGSPSTSSQPQSDSSDFDAAYYRYTWNYTANVLYGPRELSVVPNKTIYEIGDQISCSADGNPTPSYNWKEIGTGRITEGPNRTISGSLPILECTAINSIKAESKQFTIKVNSSDQAYDPVCETNVSTLLGGVLENDSVHMSCRVNYSGNCVPRMEWFRNSGQAIIHLQHTEETNEHMVLNTVTSSITLKLNSSDNGAVFICTTSFGPLSTTHPNQINISDFNLSHYRYTWNYTAKVLYGPRELSVVPIKSIYEIGDHLQCLADGNPSPLYNWTEKGTGVITQGPNITINEKFVVNQEHLLECTAFNFIGVHRKHIKIAAVDSSARSCPNLFSNCIIFYAVVGVIGLLVVVTIGAICICRYKKGSCTCNQSKDPDVVTHTEGNTHARFQNEKKDAAHSEMAVYAEVNKKVVGNAKCSTAGATHNTTEESSTVYAEVVKEKNGNTQRPTASVSHQVKDEGNLVYAEVVTGRNEPKGSKEPRDRKPKNYVGEDGTVYMDVSSCGKPPPVQQPKARPPACNTVDIYASIDHTQGALTSPRPA